MADNPQTLSSMTGRDLLPVTPSDTVSFTTDARAIRCRPDGVGGTIRFTALSGTVRNTYIAAGEVLDVGASRIHATGTAATNLEIII